jgi:hypothetical protein
LTCKDAMGPAHADTLECALPMLRLRTRMMWAVAFGTFQRVRATTALAIMMS